MSTARVLAALGGLLTVLGGVGGLSWWSSQDASAARVEDWRPKCAARMNWQQIDVELQREGSGEAYTLFGLDMSPSNEEVATTQRDAVVDLASKLPVELGTGILLVSDRSDRSSTPDLPLQAAWQEQSVAVTGVDCWPDCPTDSLFAQRCRAQMHDAVDERADELRAGLDEDRAAFAQARAAQVAAWGSELESWQPRPGTSLLGFWRKVADLPQVRRAPARTRVVLLSDLEEAGTRERAVVHRFHRRYLKHGSCPREPELPSLDGVEIILLQTVTDRIRPEPWGARWEALLGCAGARVTRHRYSPGIPLEEYLAP